MSAQSNYDYGYEEAAKVKHDLSLTFSFKSLTSVKDIEGAMEFASRQGKVLFTVLRNEIMPFALSNDDGWFDLAKTIQCLVNCDENITGIIVDVDSEVTVSVYYADQEKSSVVAAECSFESVACAITEAHDDAMFTAA